MPELVLEVELEADGLARAEDAGTVVFDDELSAQLVDMVAATDEPIKELEATEAMGPAEDMVLDNVLEMATDDDMPDDCCVTTATGDEEELLAEETMLDDAFTLVVETTTAADNETVVVARMRKLLGRAGTDWFGDAVTVLYEVTEDCVQLQWVPLDPLLVVWYGGVARTGDMPLEAIVIDMALEDEAVETVTVVF